MKKEAENLKELLNILVSLFWTSIFLGPIAWFCLKYVPSKILLAMIVISLMAYFIKPFRIKTPGISKKWINLVGRFTQDGTIVSKLLQKKYPEYRIVRTKKDLNKLYSQTRIRETFHLQMFFLFWMLFFYALWLKLWGWAAFIFISNGIYNFWPIIFLQSKMRKK
mgnify:FL=1